MSAPPSSARAVLLQRLREGTGQTLDAFAADVGLTAAEVTAVEADSFVPDPAVLWRWAEVTSAHPAAVLSPAELRTLLHESVDELPRLTLAQATHALRASTRVADAHRTTQLMLSFGRMSDAQQRLLLSMSATIADTTEAEVDEWYRFLLYRRLSGSDAPDED